MDAFIIHRKIDRMGRQAWFAVLCFLILSVVFAPAACPENNEQKEVALHYYKGVVNYEAGRYESALREFQEVARIDPYYKDSRRYMDRCVKQLETYREDIFKASDMDSRDKKVVDLYFLGRSYYEKGDYQRALDTFKLILEKEPNDKLAAYYTRLCEEKMPMLKGKSINQNPYMLGDHIDELEKEVAYIKGDIKNQQDWERFLATKAERKAVRQELVQKKEMQLKEQEELLEEERQDYLAQAALEKRAQQLQKETEKWRNMKEKLASKMPGISSDLTEFPIYLNRAETYYKQMRESLRQSRWHSAGLNAIYAGMSFCDAYLVYNYRVRSADPNHENINRLLMQYAHRSDVDENIFRIRALLNLKKLIEEEDRPIKRDEAIYAAEYAEKIVEWCRTLFP